jgi:hypothetical protein
VGGFASWKGGMRLPGLIPLLHEAAISDAIEHVSTTFTGSRGARFPRAFVPAQATAGGQSASPVTRVPATHIRGALPAGLAKSGHLRLSKLRESLFGTLFVSEMVQKMLLSSP